MLRAKPMTRSSTLHRLLRLLLALVLGLGPLGASVLADGLHSPLCGCGGCGTGNNGMGSAESCCELPRGQDAAPVLTAESLCTGRLAHSNTNANPALSPRVSEARDTVRTELERGRRALVQDGDRDNAIPRILVTLTAGDGPRRGLTVWSGPAGSRGPRGAARTIALGALRL